MKSILKLMDIKTLVAGVIPVVLGSVFSLYKYDSFSIVDMIILMVGIILIQSCANMVNDLFDFSRGADGDAKSDEKALAAGEISKSKVKGIIISFIFIDLGIALYYSITMTYYILFVAVIGGLIMYLYSAGKHPISYTPFGELVAGATMGFGIMTTVIYIQSGVFSIATIAVAIPTSIYIGTILLTNNISDHIEDKVNGRKTLPIVLGIEKAEKLWVLSCYLMIFTSFVLVLFDMMSMQGLVIAVFIIPHKKIQGFRYINKVVQNKGEMMGLINNIGVKFHVAMILGLLISKYIRT